MAKNQCAMIPQDGWKRGWDLGYDFNETNPGAWLGDGSGKQGCWILCQDMSCFNEIVMVLRYLLVPIA